MAINQVVAGAAALTSSATAFSASVPGAGQTFAVASDAGYPVTGRFVVQLNRGESDEEKVLVSSRSGTTFTVETRGYDGTTPQSHTNPTVNLILPATVVNALIDHADDIESDPHSTKLLNNTRHDTTSRHTLGTVIPTSASAPVAIAPDDTGSAGSANSVARSDHRHAITTDTVIAVSTALAEGTATSFARSDHSHTIGTGVINSSGMFAAGVVDAAAIATDAVGSAEIAADAVGAAEIATGAVGTAELAAGVYGSPVTVGTANSDGAATTVARSNHVHAAYALGHLATPVRRSLDQGGMGSGITDFTGLAITVTAGSSRRIRIRGHVYVEVNNTDTNVDIVVREGSTILGKIGWFRAYVANASGVVEGSVTLEAPSSGAHTYKLSGSSSGGSTFDFLGTDDTGWIECIDEGPV